MVTAEDAKEWWEVWDIETRNLLADFDTEAEAIAWRDEVGDQNLVIHRATDHD